MSAARIPRLTLRLSDSWGESMAGVVRASVWTGWAGCDMSRTNTPRRCVGFSPRGGALPLSAHRRFAGDSRARLTWAGEDRVMALTAVAAPNQAADAPVLDRAPPPARRRWMSWAAGAAIGLGLVYVLITSAGGF